MAKETEVGAYLWVCGFGRTLHLCLSCDVVRLYEQLRELEEKRDTVLQEVQAMGTPEQERERLLKQVKEDNTEIASAERQYVNTSQLVMIKDSLTFSNFLQK